jgi:membrane protease YdiL (CAAX protease family)
MGHVPASSVLERSRETTWLVLTLAIGACFGLALVNHADLGTIDQSLHDLQTATGGLVGPTLVRNSITLAVVSLVIFGFGRLRPTDVGWHAGAVGPALLIVVAVWTVMHAALALVVGLGEGQLAWHKGWHRPGFVAGGLLGQFLGTALLEETLFRGFLLPQFYVKACRVCRPGLAMLIALLGSQGLFALVHIPSQVAKLNLTVPELLVEQSGIFLLGLLFATLYIVTRNLFVGVGLHALANERALVVQVPDTTSDSVFFGLTVMLLLSWPLARRFRTRGAAPIAPQNVAEAPA